MGPATLSKQMRITLVCPGQERRSALVTLTRTITGPTIRWSATTSVEDHGEHVCHATVGHATERDALVAIAEWLRRTFRASTTCLGGTVTIVGVSPLPRPHDQVDPARA